MRSIGSRCTFVGGCGGRFSPSGDDDVMDAGHAARSLRLVAGRTRRTECGAKDDAAPLSTAGSNNGSTSAAAGVSVSLPSASAGSRISRSPDRKTRCHPPLCHSIGGRRPELPRTGRGHGLRLIVRRSVLGERAVAQLDRVSPPDTLRLSGYRKCARNRSGSMVADGRRPLDPATW